MADEEYEEVVADGGMSGISLSHGGYSPPRGPRPDFGDGVVYAEEGEEDLSDDPATSQTSQDQASTTGSVVAKVPGKQRGGLKRKLLVFVGVPVALGGIAGGIVYSQAKKRGTSEEDARNMAIGTGVAVAGGSVVLSWLVGKI